MLLYVGHDSFKLLYVGHVHITLCGTYSFILLYVGHDSFLLLYESVHKVKSHAHNDSFILLYVGHDLFILLYVGHAKVTHTNTTSTPSQKQTDT